MADAELVLRARDETQSAFSAVTAQLDALKGAFAGVSGLAAGLTGAAAGSYFVGLTRGAVDLGDQLNKLSQKVGISVEALSALRYAGQLSDVSTEQLGTGLAKLARSMDEGNVAFQRLGISVRDSSGNLRGTQDVLGEVADKFAGMEDGAGKTALAMALFGKSGADLIPLLNAGRSGLAQYADEAKRAGLIVSGELAAAAEKLNDDMSRLKLGTEALGIAFASNIVPALDNLLQQMLKGREIFGSFGSALLNIGVAVDPFKSLAENLRAYTAEVDRLKGLLANPELRGTRLASSLQSDLETASKRLEFLRFQQRQQIADTSGPGNYDARDYQASRAPAKSKAPGLLPERGAKARAASSDGYAGQDMVERYNDNAFLRQLDEAERARKELADDLLRQMEEGNRVDASLAKQQEERINQLLSGTSTFEEKRAQNDIEDLNAALRSGNIDAVAYDEAFAKIQERLNDLRGVPKDFIAKVPDEAADAFRRLENAVKGWGNQFNETLVQMVKTGKVNFGTLVDSILSDLARLAIYQSITAPLFSALSKGISNAFGSGGSTTGAGIGDGAAQGLRMPKPQASGGPVSAGSPYLIGERGVELFVPSRDGTIVPNGGLGGGSVVVNMPLTVNVDARSDINSVYDAVQSAVAMSESNIARAFRTGRA